MANQSIKRQIERIQATLDVMKPKDPASIKILLESDPAAGGDTQLDFLLEVREAKKTHDQVIVVRSMDGALLDRKHIDGVTYVRNEWEAMFLQLSGQPSERGNSNRLDDVLKGLSGKVMGVVANPSRDFHVARSLACL